MSSSTTNIEFADISPFRIGSLAWRIKAPKSFNEFDTESRSVLLC